MGCQHWQRVQFSVTMWSTTMFVEVFRCMKLSEECWTPRITLVHELKTVLGAQHKTSTLQQHLLLQC